MSNEPFAGAPTSPAPTGWRPGTTLERNVIDHLSPTQIVQYAGVAGDYNPAHSDHVYATKVAGYPSVFAHGALTMGLSSRALVDIFGLDAVRTFGGRFTAQVWPGDSLTVSVTIASSTPVPDGLHIAADLSTRNQHGLEVFRGYATAVLSPSRSNTARAERDGDDITEAR